MAPTAPSPATAARGKPAAAGSNEPGFCEDAERPSGQRARKAHNLQSFPTRSPPRPLVHSADFPGVSRVNQNVTRGERQSRGGAASCTLRAERLWVEGDLVQENRQLPGISCGNSRSLDSRPLGTTVPSGVPLLSTLCNTRRPLLSVLPRTEKTGGTRRTDESRRTGFRGWSRWEKRKTVRRRRDSAQGAPKPHIHANTTL